MKDEKEIIKYKKEYDMACMEASLAWHQINGNYPPSMVKSIAVKEIL